jgi:serine/threonine-protein kinase
MVSSEAVGMEDRAAPPALGSADWNGASSSLSDDCVPRALGRYVLLKRIARGGMGEVFLASTTGIEGAERPVVVKIIRREHATDPSFIARFLDEARVQAQLQHSGVAQVIEATLDERTGEPYAVVEHVEGRSLGDLRTRALQIGHAFGWADAVAMATLIAEALAHVHERLDASGRALAIVHRDLSPQNVMVSYVGECKIIDFGTARGQNRRCHTVAGVVFAKPGYVAPEVANGDSGDARVDVYALGVMLWELCAGRRFLQGDAAAHMSAVARHAKELPPIAAEAGAPTELDAIIAKLTAFDRDTRYGAARHAASDLARLLTAAPALANGERGVRARVAALMATLFPGEPGKGRREFARLVSSSRALAEPSRANRTAQALQAGQSAQRQPPTPRSDPPPAEPAPAAKEGDVLGGTRYKLVREIGRGASSVVYEAEHLDLGKRVAIKIIAECGSDEPHDAGKTVTRVDPAHADRDGASSTRGGGDQAARFRREARTLSRLSHEGLVTVHDVGQATDGRLFCVMELLDGETLEARLARCASPTGDVARRSVPPDARLSHAEVLALTRRVLTALEVAHKAALVHRDVKPANIFLPRAQGAGGTAVKLLDFGLARGVGEPESGTSPDGKGSRVSIFGTPEYMAPEQATGTSDARADLYAVGCVVYEMLTGRLPFVGPSAVAILDAKAKGNPESPRSTAPTLDIPLALDALVMKALARHPSERFQTASEMIRALDAVAAAPTRGRRGRLVVASAMLSVGLLAAAAFGVARIPRLRAALPWPHRQAQTTVVVAAVPVADPTPEVAQPASGAPTAQPDPATMVATAPPADAQVDDEGFDIGEDGDFVDDVPPAAAPVAAADPVAAEKPQRHKRKKAPKKSAAPDDAPRANAAPDAAPPHKDKARKKHKTKVAEVQ